MRVLGFILFFALLLILGSIRLNAQTVLPTGSATQLTYQRGGYGAERVFAIPALDTTVINTLFPTYRDSGRVCMFAGNFFYHDGGKWATPSSAPDSSIFATRWWVGDNYVPLTRTINGIGLSSNINLTTTDIPEGNNLYFTQSRARQSISVSGGLLSYDNSTGVIGLTSASLGSTAWLLGGNATSAVQSIGSTTAFPIRFVANGIRYDSLSILGNRVMFAPASNAFDYYTWIDAGGAQMLKFTRNSADLQFRFGNNTTGVNLSVVTGSGSAMWTYASNSRHISAGSYVIQGNTLVFAPITNAVVDFRNGGEGGTTNMRFTASGRLLLGSGAVGADNLTDIFQASGSIRGTILKSTNINAGSLSDSLVSHVAGGEYQRIAPITTIISNIDTATATSASITLSKRGAYAFTGTTATWTLPASASTPTYYLIKNRGTGNLTIVTTGAANTIYETALTNTLIVLPTGSYTIFYDGSIWNVKN